MNSFKSVNSILSSGLTVNPVKVSTFLVISGNISLENDSNSVNWTGKSESPLILSDNCAISFSSSISTEIWSNSAYANSSNSPITKINSKLI